MKLHLYIIAFFLSLFVSESLYSKGYKINIQINGFHNDTVYLINYYGNKSFVKDTAILNRNGVGFFEGTNNLIPGIYAVVLPKKQFFDFLINQEYDFKITTDTSDIFGKLRFEGADESDWYLQFQRHMIQTHNKPDTFIRELIAKHPNTLFSRYASLSLNPEYVSSDTTSSPILHFQERYTFLKDHYFDNLDFSDSLLLRTPAFHEKINHFFNSILSQQNDTIIKQIVKLIAKINTKSPVYKYLVSYLLNNYQQAQYSKLENVYVYLADSFYLNGKAPWASERYTKLLKDRVVQLKTSLIGQKAPNLILENMKRELASIYEIKAEHLLLIFYDVDCNQCRTDINDLKNIMKTSSIKGLKIVAIYIHADLKNWEKFIRENDLHWINLYDPSMSSNFKKLYNIQKVPELVLLDKNKIIVDKYFTAEQLGKMMMK